jgi:hypothetical protein
VQGTLAVFSPRRFFIPQYVGHNGWVGVWLDVELDWEIALVEESCRMTAPKRLLKPMEAPKPSVADS